MEQKNTAEKRIRDLSTRLEQRKEDQQNILLERIRDRDHAQIYTEMLTKCETEITWLTGQIESIRNYDETIRHRKAKMKSVIEMMDEIIAERKISDAHLRMLVEKIIIHERDNRLQVEICLKADFRQHIDSYDENGNLSEKAFEMIVQPDIGSKVN